MSKQETQRAWYLKNRERLRVEAKARYWADPEAHRAKSKKNYKQNPDRLKEYGKLWYKKNRERVQIRERERKYGLSQSGFEAILDSQKGSCAICRKTFTGIPHVDHDHVTGKVRGLLCTGCNIGIGHFRDDPLIAVRAASYLS